MKGLRGEFVVGFKAGVLVDTVVEHFDRLDMGFIAHLSALPVTLERQYS
jgi:hypothetical protein